MPGRHFTVAQEELRVRMIEGTLSLYTADMEVIQTLNKI